MTKAVIFDFGYVTATLATFLIEREAGNKHSVIADVKQVRNLQNEITVLRYKIKTLSDKINA